jgi:hypothetical protein
MISPCLGLGTTGRNHEPTRPLQECSRILDSNHSCPGIGALPTKTHNYHDYYGGRAPPLSDKLSPPRTQTFYTKAKYSGVSSLGREQTEAYTTPLEAIRQGGAYLKTLCPYLTAAVCGPMWTATPLGEAWQPSKGEQYQSRGSAP